MQYSRNQRPIIESTKIDTNTKLMKQKENKVDIIEKTENVHVHLCTRIKRDDIDGTIEERHKADLVVPVTTKEIRQRLTIPVTTTKIGGKVRVKVTKVNPQDFGSIPKESNNEK